MSSRNIRSSSRLICSIAALASLSIWAELAFAGSGDLKTIVGTVKTNIESLADLLTIVSYISGIGFCIAGIVQFKAHKDNPAQVPLSKPLVYLGVGAALLFLPSIMESAGSTIFGEGTGKSAASGKTGL